MLLFLWLARLRERWLGKRGGRIRKHNRATRPRLSRRLELEALEDRLVLSPGIPPLSGSWTELSSLPTPGLGTMLLLPNGNVMVQGSGVTNSWYELTPNASGSYTNGTWSKLASMSQPRLYFGSAVLPSDKVFVLGGEYPSFTNSGEIYNLATNSWSSIPNFPQSGFGDDPTNVLPNGDILCGYAGGPQTYLYNPTTNSWSNGPAKLDSDGSDEETWVKLPVSAALPQGGILSYSIFASISSGTFKGQVYNIATNTWTETLNSKTSPPAQLSSNAIGAELGGGLVLPNGKVFQIGANGNTALYDPSSNTWSAGPQILDSKANLCGSDDAPATILPDGQVVFSADYGPIKGTFSSPAELFDYDYNTNTITQITSLPATLSGDLTGGPAYVDRSLVLPSGQLLFDDGINMFVFTPSDSPQNAWRPTITSVANLGVGSYVLTGTQLSGLSEGSSYGDDVNVSENYPIVQLTDSSGNVHYMTTSNWSNVLVSGVGDTTSESVDFTLPAGFAKGAYQLAVIANGISSNQQTFVVGSEATVTAQNASTPFSPNNQTVSLTADVNAVGSPQTVNEGTVTFTVKDSKGNKVGAPVTGSVVGGVASANFTLPANEPAGAYAIDVGYTDSLGNFFDGGDTNATLTITPAKAATAAANVSTAYSLSSQTVTLNATLADSSIPSDKVSEGNVTFTILNGSTIIGSVKSAVSGNAASATFTLPAGLAPGSYTLAVSYGDSAGNFSDSGDTSGILTVTPANITTTASNVLAVYRPGAQSVALSANIADTSFSSDKVDEGNVTFTIEQGSTIIGSVTSAVSFDVANANFTLPAGQAAGKYTISASYSDSLGNFSDSADTSATLTVAPAIVTTTAANASTAYNTGTQTLTLSANLANASFASDPINEGVATFTIKNGSTILGSVSGTVSGGTSSASFTVPAGLPPGGYTVAVNYGDSLGNFSDSSDKSATLTVTHANVTTTANNGSLLFSTNPQTLALSATVANASSPSDTVNEGDVVFTIKQGSTIIGNVDGTVSGGKASANFDWSAGRAAGNYTIAVSYTDSAGNFNDSSDTSGTLTVTAANVTTTAQNPPAVIHSSDPQTVALTASVADVTIPSDTVNEGSVTFTILDGSKLIGSVSGAVVGGTASANFTVPAGQAAGSYTVAVSYSDSAGNFSDSGDTSGILTVTPASVATTANNASAIFSPNTRSLALSATVANISVPTQPVSEGSVTFTILDGSTVVGSVSGAVSGGTANANFTVPAGLAAGSYSIAVGYTDSKGSFIDSGDTSAALTVTTANVATTAVNTSTVFSPKAQTVALSANVADISIPSDTVDEGTVTFTIKNGATTLASVTGAISGGKANANFALPAGQSVGSYTVEVSYSDSSKNFVDDGETFATLAITPANVTTTANNLSIIHSTKAQTVTFSATVANASIPSDTVDEGVVTFTIKNGATTLASVSGAVSGGKASANFTLPASMAAGSYTIAVSYSDSLVNFTDGGDTNGTLTVTPANVTTTANIVSTAYSISTQTVKLSAAVADASIPSDTVNEGIVTFTISDGSTVLGSVEGSVGGGVASAAFTLPAGQAPGSYTVAVSYSDSQGNFSDSGDTSAALAIASASATPAASASAAAVYSLSAQTVTLNATITDASVPSDTINEGIVTFTIKNGTMSLGSVSGTVSGGTASANFTLPAGLVAGNYTIAVSYSDSAGKFSDGGDTYATLTIAPADATTAAASAGTTFRSTPQTVTLSAAIADPGGPNDNTVNEGTVNFMVQSGATVIGSARGTVNGGIASANFTLPAGLAAGSYTVAVSYTDSQGNFIDNGDSNGTLTIGTAASTVQLTQINLAPTLFALQTTETLTAHVSSSTPVTQGAVTFVVAGQTVSANVDGNGNATATVIVPMLDLLGPQDVSIRYNNAANNLTASASAQTAGWQLLNAVLPSTVTFTASGQSITADLFGLFITYTDGLLAEIDFGSSHLVFSYNAFDQLVQVMLNGKALLS